MMPTELESLVLSISADTAQVRRALKRMESDSKETARNVENAFDNVVPFDRMQQGFSRSAKAMAGDAQNLRFQFNDLYTQISSGTGVAQAFAQQAGQISQVLGSAGGLRGGVALVGQALAGMLNPLYAIPIAISAAMPLIASFFSSTEQGAKDATAALDEQLAVINRLRAAQGLEGVQRGGQSELDLFIAMRDAMRTNIEIAGQLANGLNEISGEILSIPVGEFEGQTHTIQQLDSALRKLEEGVKNGNPDFLEFAKTMQEIEARKNLSDNIAALVTQVADLAAKAALAERNMSDLQEAMAGAAQSGRELSSMMIQFPQQLSALTSAGGQFINTPEMQKRVDEYRRLAGEAKGITAQFIKDEEQFRAEAYGDTRTSTGKFDAWRVGFGSDTYVNELGEIQRVTERTVVTLEQANADLARRIGEFQAVIQRQIGADYWASLSEQQQAALTSIAYNFGNLPDSIVAAIKQGDRGKVAQAIASLSANPERRQREAALYGGGAFSARAAETDAAASSTDRLTDSTNQLSAADQRLAGVGSSVIAGLDQQRTAADQLAQAYAQIGQSAVSGLVSDLREGVSAGEAFSNMLNRVIDGLVNMAIQAMFSQQALGGLFGGGGGLFSGGGMGVGLYHQGGKVGSTAVPRRTVPAAMFANAPRLHNGLRAGEFPAILQRGETVIPRSSAMTRSAVAAAAGDTNIGDIAITVPTQVAATTEQGKALGLQINRAVQKILIDEQRGGGILSPGRRLS
ncbi:hypothetical protein GOD68_17920 [Sinorhizobium medicae]|nr:hypothetical protein [Sinorhizobium medicae]MDX0671893.1 hypothetical protein [Sinorhizobium medicae]MDX0709173.1 hypothetical protein [Sinorhizobium medicae]